MAYTLFDIQKKIHDSMKEQALSYEIPSNKLLEKYKEDWEFYSNRSFKQCNKNKLLKKIRSSDFCFLGDFHTFDQSTKNLIRILKTAFRTGKDLSIGLEMIHAQYQEEVDSYLFGHLTDLEFLEMVNYTESWRFPWGHYKVIFDFAKKYGMRILALNSHGSLEDRDQFAAKLIAKRWVDSGDTVLVLFGELHIMPNKLPHFLKEQLSELNYEQVIIHQNMDEVYWKAINSEDEIDDFKLVEFSDDEFCLISSPPWMKNESLIYWYEGIINDYEFDVHQVMLEKGIKTFTENPIDKYQSIRSFITQYLEVQDLAEDVQVYDHSSASFLNALVKKDCTDEFKEIYLDLLRGEKSFYWPEKKIIFCSHYSVNHLAYLVGLELGWKKVSSIENLKLLGESKKNLFIFSIYIEMISFLCSRVLNPFFKCELYLNYDSKYREFGNKDSGMVLAFIDDFSGELKKVENFSSKVIFKLARSCGQLLGDHFYSLYRIDKPTFTGEKLKREIMGKINSQEAILKLIKELLDKKHFKMRKKRVF